MRYLRSVKLPTLLPLLFVLFQCTRDRAPETTELQLPTPPTAWREDTAYVTRDGAPALLLGFDLSDRPLGATALRTVVDQLQANRANYLRVSTASIDSSGVAEELTRALRFGIHVDTTARARAVSGLRPFHALLLAGAGRVAFDDFNQAALNALRGIRTVERHVNFWELTEDAGLLGADNPTGAHAAADANENYVIYIPTTGNVTVRFRDGRQVPRRVTVVGHLGTQRSEVLRPPYGRTFTLLSNDERGGWMLIEPLED